ncbi:MAG: hypothetical protein LBT37_07960 [Lactobacillaceae bacterium]|jgi:hypothetical protein|nr:hypothetical protein [Lactobacillaceae bacterium]
MDQLQRTLSDLVQSNSETNPNFDMLVNDYVRWHLVRIFFGGFVFLSLVLLIIILWRKFKRTPAKANGKWSFEKTVYAIFGTFNIFIALPIFVVVGANIKNAVNPLHGFGLFTQEFAQSKVSGYSNEMCTAFNSWLQSGKGAMQPILKQQIHEIIRLYTIKAIIFGALFILVAILNIYLWKLLIKKSRKNIIQNKTNLKEKFTLIFGSIFGMITTGISLCVMVVFLVNLQKAFAPLSAFLIGLT